MRRKLHQAVFSTAAPLLQEGERPELASRARLGFTLGRAVVLSAAWSLTSGTAGTYAMAKAFYVLLTDRRLLVLESHWLTFRPVAELVAELSRRSLVVTDVAPGFMTLFTVASADHPDPIQLSFPRTEQREARELLRALGVAV